MPPLKRPSRAESIEIPARSALVAAETEVAVVGGGPAGLGAALGAAGIGVRTIVAEQYGFFGGNATAALVMPFASYHTEHPQPEKAGSTSLTPSDHGGGEPVIGGAVERLVASLVKAGGAIPPSTATGFVVPFDPEVFKAVAFQLLDSSGIDFLLHAYAIDILPPYNGFQQILFDTKTGPVVIRARSVVDCTGDGDLAVRAGATYEIGRETDGLVQPMTLMFRMAQFEPAAFTAYTRAHPDQWRGVHGLWDLVKRAAEEGELELPREDILFFGTPHDNEVAINSTRIGKVLGTDVWDLTYAEWVGRKQVQAITAFLKKYVPGFEASYSVQSGMTVGTRESRRILGDYILTAEDVLAARKFDDVIAHGTYPIDIHNPSGGPGTVLMRVPPGEAYDIPLRCLIPRHVDNLLVAGRCISGTHEALSSYRVMPISMATGQAAGICAALAVKGGTAPRRVAAYDVQRELRRQGAILRGTSKAPDRPDP